MKTLFSKLLIRFILISLILIIIMGFSLIYFFKGFYFSIKEEEIINDSQIILAPLSQAILKGDKSSVQKWLEIIARQNDGQAWLIDKDGNLVMSFPTLGAKKTQVNFERYKEIFKGNIITQRVESRYFERPMLLIGVPFLKVDNSKYGLMVFTSVSGINSTIDRVQTMMIYFSLVAIALGFIISFTWSKSLSKPLKKMSEIAFELSNGEFGKTIELSKEEDNEIGKLANSINYMSRTLKTTIDNLLSERNKLKYVLTGMEEGILAINNRKEIIIINNSAKRILDIRHEEPVGHQLSSLVSQDKIVELISKSLDDEFVVQDEFLLNIDNSDKRILLRCTPIYSNGKSLWGVVALFQDISQRWRFEQLQKDFVANVSHELKAPLSSIKGAGEILLDKVIVDSDKQDEYLEMIIEETDRLEDLVNDILTLSESDSSKSNYKRNKVNVNILLEKVTQIFKKIIDQENYKLETVLLEKDEYISMSEEKSKQVLLNLLENAYKFSSDGFIKIGAKNLSGEIKFWVKDYGIGISENEIDNIWERFYKVDKAHTPGTSGSGLGLSIVKQIIENNGGRVFVESKYGCGSTFGFYLPKI